MALWQRLLRRSSSARLTDVTDDVTLGMEGWTEDAPNDGMRIWRNEQQDVLSLKAPSPSFKLPSVDEVGLQQWCRAVAEGRGAGLIEVRSSMDGHGRMASFIYKRLKVRAFVFTGMLVMPVPEGWLVWTIVSGEQGTTGVREAIITAQLINAGKLSIEDYQRSWARDPYDSDYAGVDRHVLRFTSDDECYDEQFPEHPLSKVRRVLAALPGAVHIERGPRH